MEHKFYTLYVYLDDVQVSFGTVNEYFDCGALVQQANQWAGENNWNRLELGPEKSYKKFGEEAA